MAINWDKRYMQLAEFVSSWSKDPKAHVGAVVTTANDGAIALGYNGFPRGVEDRASRLKNQELKLEMIVHAEQNALRIAGRGAQGEQFTSQANPSARAARDLLFKPELNALSPPTRMLATKIPSGIQPG